MEIHMKGVNWGVDALRLTRELAKVLHSSEYEELLPRMNFHVFLKRDARNGRNHAGWGFLTLPTKDIGLKFLADFGAPLKNFYVFGRAITFSQSKKECKAEILERITQFPYFDPKHLKDNEDRTNRLQSTLVRINAVQFGRLCQDDFFSIEWENISHTEYHLSFNAERNEVRIALERYLIVMRYSQINYISLDRHSSEPSIYFNLSVPPSFERNMDTPRQRLSYLPFDDHARVAPYTSLAMRVICSSVPDMETFQNMCKYAQMQGKVDDHEIWTCRRELFSSEVVSQYQEWVEGLRWDVAFQIEAIVRNMLVDLREMLSLKHKISVIMRQHDWKYASEMLKHFASRLFQYDDVEGDVSQWFDNAAKEYAKISGAPALEPTDGSLFQALHVTITPTTMYLEGPVPERSNRVIRSYNPSNHTSFLRVNFMDEGGLTYRFDRDIDGRDFTKRRVGGFLANGLTIAGRHFRFLAYSQSALKEHSVWFVRDFFDPEHGRVTAETIIASLGQFSDLTYDKELIFCPARYAARLSQAFTATDASVKVEIEEIQMINDIKTTDEKYCFTDGVGTVSLKLAEDIWNELSGKRRKARNKKTHPKAFQIRFQGSKGMLCVNHRLSGRMLCLRESMIKFTDLNSRVIEVARAFDRPAPYFLNRPLIMLLEGLGVKYEVFKEFQDLIIKQTHDAVSSTDTAARMLESYGLGTSYTVPSVLLQFHKRGIQDIFANEFWDRSMDFAVYHVLRELKNHARIPIPDAWTLVGVADEHKYLREGEIFACVKPLTGGTIYLEGDILISRSPTIHPGDVQIVRAIGPPPPGSPFEKEPLPNTVVFTTEGTRPLQTCLGGGDLDGDLYNLLPLDKMPDFRPRSTEKPASYNPALKRLLKRPSNMNDVADFVVEFINSDVVGIIAINWLIIADQSPENIFDESCLKLAQLHSDAVDYPKSGNPVELESIPKLKFKNRPDWNAPETATENSGKYYESRRAIGRLFREVDLPKVRSTVGAAHRRHRGQPSRTREHVHASGTIMAVSDDIIGEINALVDEYIGHESWVNDEPVAIIQQIYDRYVLELRAICANNKLSHSHTSSLTEEEAFMGTIVAKTSQPRRRKELMSKLREQTDILVRGVREELSGDYDTALEEVLEWAWLAWDHALSEGAVFGAQTFGWIALHLIFETTRQIDADRKESGRRFY
ncbi:hypothetical protein AX15_001164 [Amanita polypyramis BW_CC]|nr:hypothetical protein AX15_001164 [Amanita polypyramis BW_CC]